MDIHYRLVRGSAGQTRYVADDCLRRSAGGDTWLRERRGALAAADARLLNLVGAEPMPTAHHPVAFDAVVDGIESLALQTRLMALNATLEAARTGHRARGFAVVADAVGLLATRAATTTRKLFGAPGAPSDARSA
ncbi:MAG: hypothetical protein KIT73_04705 [Burkholderiales bacterium]|nr:hypothetical protein [Burkholderiales bacterium]